MEKTPKPVRDPKIVYTKVRNRRSSLKGKWAPLRPINSLSHACAFTLGHLILVVCVTLSLRCLYLKSVENYLILAVYENLDVLIKYHIFVPLSNAKQLDIFIYTVTHTRV